MSRYIVQIVGPSGMERYLSHGKEVESPDNATHFYHPSGARAAGRNYAKRHDNIIVSVVDTRDVERIV